MMIAPVAGSGSWPAWMQTVLKRASGGSFKGCLSVWDAEQADSDRRSSRASEQSSVSTDAVSHGSSAWRLDAPIRRVHVHARRTSGHIHLS